MKGAHGENNLQASVQNSIKPAIMQSFFCELVNLSHIPRPGPFPG